MKKKIYIALSVLCYLGLATAMWNFSGAAWVFFCGVVFGAGVLGGIAHLYLKKNYDLQKKLPYRWSCTKGQCHLILSNSRWDGLMRMADEHNREIHGIEGVM